MGTALRFAFVRTPALPSDDADNYNTTQKITNAYACGAPPPVRARGEAAAPDVGFAGGGVVLQSGVRRHCDGCDVLRDRGTPRRGTRRIHRLLERRGDVRGLLGARRPVRFEGVPLLLGERTRRRNVEVKDDAATGDN